VSGSSRLLKQETEIQVEVTNFILSAAKPAAAKNLTPYNHDRIVKAIRNRQPAAARDAMAEHAEQTFAWVTVVI
jgi:DNA-binding GntR family transcriptional regulator